MENTQLSPEIRQIYEDYLGDTIRLEDERKPTDGLFGFGKRSDFDPCHDRFTERLEQAVNDIAAGKPSSEVAYSVLHFVFEAPIVNNDNRQAYWMLLAVHGLTDKLISFLSPEDAADLTAWYSQAYPKHVRLPVQKTIAAHLQAQAGKSLRKRKSLLEFFKGAK